MFMLCMAPKLHSANASICSYAIELALLSSYAPKERRGAVMFEPLSSCFAFCHSSIHCKSGTIEMCIIFLIAFREVQILLWLPGS